MSYNPENALIIQSDRTILLEVHSPQAEAAREAIAPFAELIKSRHVLVCIPSLGRHSLGEETSPGSDRRVRPLSWSAFLCGGNLRRVRPQGRTASDF